MGHCLMCNRSLNNTLTLKELLSFQPYEEPFVCAPCYRQFRPIEQMQSCPGCSRPQEDKQYCQDCIRWQKELPSIFLNHKALFSYDETLKTWLQTYKSQGDVRYAKIMSEALHPLIKLSRSSTIVPLPISQASMAKRGFNQCEELLKSAGVPYRLILINQSQGKKQSEKNRKERLETEQPFVVQKEMLAGIKKIILFDDLYTTGRTINHAKKILVAAGVQEIYSLSIGR